MSGSEAGSSTRGEKAGRGSDGNPSVNAGAGTAEPVDGQTPRLVASWLIVGVPLAYGIYQTISKTLPLFGG